MGLCRRDSDIQSTRSVTIQLQYSYNRGHFKAKKKAVLFAFLLFRLYPGLSCSKLGVHSRSTDNPVGHRLLTRRVRILKKKEMNGTKMENTQKA